MTRYLFPTLLLLLRVSACGGDDDTPTPTPVPTPTPEPSPTPPPDPVEIALEPLFVQPRIEGVSEGITVINSVETWNAYFNQTAPAGLADGTRTALVWYAGNDAFLSRSVRLNTLTYQAQSDILDLDASDRRFSGCETFSAALPVLSVALMERWENPPPIELSTTQTAQTCETGADRDMPCTVELLCGSGLICAGLTHGDEGYCRPAWMHGVFAIPASTIAPSGLTSIPIEVSGLATVDIDAVVSLDIDHPHAEDLLITLVNVATSEGTVWSSSSSVTPPGHLVVPVYGFPGDEYINGEWTLQIYNEGPDAGSFVGGSLELTSRYD